MPRISVSGLHRWVAQAEIEEGSRPGLTSSEIDELRLLSNENLHHRSRGCWTVDSEERRWRSVSYSNEDQDHHSRPRWSANRKIDVVLRLLRGESIEDVSREVGVEVHRLAG